MTPQPLPQSPAYQEVVSGLLRMHQYTIDSQDESDEADALRERMDEPWHRLTASERERITGLSKDLYTVSGPAPTAPDQMNPQAQGKLAEAYEARERGEWDGALEFLRRWGKYIPPPLLSYLRAKIWEDAGDKAIAAVFFHHAWQLEPSNEHFRAGYLNCLKWTDYPHAGAGDRRGDSEGVREAQSKSGDPGGGGSLRACGSDF